VVILYIYIYIYINTYTEPLVSKSYSLETKSQFFHTFGHPQMVDGGKVRFNSENRATYIRLFFRDNSYWAGTDKGRRYVDLRRFGSGFAVL